MPKLTKKKLISLTKKGLSYLGYTPIKTTIIPAQGLYIKTVGELYLSLGLTIHRFYDCKFTGDYYLSKITSWATYWGDIPKNSYCRVGQFLTEEERGDLLHKDQSKVGIDAWWDLDDEGAVENFLEAVRITESRFVNQEGLIDAIAHSKDIDEMWKLGQSTLDIVTANALSAGDFKFTPNKSIDDIPLEWFMAAEQAIKTEGIILNVNTVKNLAARAYVQNTLASI